MKTVTTTTNAGLQNIISTLQQEKEMLSSRYNLAIKNGEKYAMIKNMYLTLKDVDKRLGDLLRSNYSSVSQ